MKIFLPNYSYEVAGLQYNIDLAVEDGYVPKKNVSGRDSKV
jgi:hypothetical protein